MSRKYIVKLGTEYIVARTKIQADLAIRKYLTPYKVHGRWYGPDHEHPVTKNQNWWDASGRWLASRELAQ